MAVAHEITHLMADRGHEQLVFVADAPSGLRALIAIHSTALGPSLGGVRFWHYDAESDAVADVLRLSEAMTYKAAVAGLDQGGGKTVVMVDDPDRPRDEALLLALGRAIDELGGRYLAAEDVGATPRDMDVIARVTPWVTGLDEALGGSGDPSPVTAIGVRAGMRAVRDALDGTTSLEGLQVVVHGTGHVGAHLARLLAADGAVLTVADRAPGRAEALAAELGAAVVAPDTALDLECDVLAPCALGPVIDLDRVARLRCRAVCGAANNQLADLDVDDALAARGILYAPDFVVNAGGIINLAEERGRGGYRERALARAEQIEATTAAVLVRADADGVAPGRAAEAIARERIAREGKGYWRPEDSVPWRT